MTTKADIIAAIQAVADATGDNNLRIAMGAPGNHLKNSAGETQPTAKAWLPEPRMWAIVAEGLAVWADAQGLSGVAAIKGKLNELIGQYNQLLADYNNGVVPSTAEEVDPLP